METFSKDCHGLLVVDTDDITANYPEPSQDPRLPTKLDETAWFWLYSKQNSVQASSKGSKLIRIAHHGTLSVWAISVDGNSSNAVLLYGFTQSHAGKVVIQAMPHLSMLSGAAQPDPDQMNGLPALQCQQSFNNWVKMMNKVGKSILPINVAVYTLSDDGETQVLYGYFYLEISVEVFHVKVGPSDHSKQVS